MLLTVDIGNTNITLGIFDDNKFLNEFRIPSDRDLSIFEYEILLKSLLKDYYIDGCVIASVVEELTSKFETAIVNSFCVYPFIVSDKTLTGIKIKIDNPSELGADRIANACAVSDSYNSAVIVIDFGTATTFDIINSSKEFLGGIIMPGVNTQLKSLKNSTSKLPKIDASSCRKAIGTNTQDAILSGVILGCACAIDGLIQKCKKELNQDVVIIGTGGYCGLVAQYMNTKFDAIDPLLTLKGLKNIYQSQKIKNHN